MSTSYKESIFHPYGLGIVLSAKYTAPYAIKAYPLEDLPFMGGELKVYESDDKDFEYNIVGDDGQEIKKKVKFKQSNYIDAVWKQHTNRVTAPKVRPGEQVQLYQVGDTDQYYWDVLGRDDVLRQGENAVWAFDATGHPKQNADYTIHAGNSYMITIKTDGDNKIEITTSKIADEYCTWNILLDTNNGELVIRNEKGDVFSINPKAHTIRLKNRDQVYFEMNHQNYDENVPQNKHSRAQKWVHDGDVYINGTLYVSNIINTGVVNANVVNAPITNTVVYGGIVESYSGAKSVDIPDKYDLPKDQPKNTQPAVSDDEKKKQRQALFQKNKAAWDARARQYLRNIYKYKYHGDEAKIEAAIEHTLS